MGISKLNETIKECIGGASIFSGRPDPTWSVGEEVAKKLEKIWGSLEPWTGEHPSAPPLGYRGCFIRCKPDIEWFAYEGVVTLKTPDGSESRIDKGKKFEKLLLSSAPEGLLPLVNLETWGQATGVR
jgi:hypothetical protein